MVDSKAKITGFEQLTVWQEAQLLAVEVYKASKGFPSDEKFGMTNQLRRAVASISANIAEGFGRASVNEKIQYYRISYGSLLETKNFVYLAHKLGYLQNETHNNLINRCLDNQKLLNATIKSLNQNV